MAHPYPENFARFYDLIYHQLRDTADQEFFQNEIRQAEGKVLEVGVGTGRLFRTALAQGADIHGIDISPSMLEVLSGKLTPAQRKRITLQDMVDFSFDFKFDLVIAPFRVIMHLQDKEAQIRAINNVQAHLHKGGRFIFDTFIPDLNQLLTGIENLTDFEGEYAKGRKVRRSVSTKPDLINQVIQVRFTLEWEDEDGPRREEWETRLRYFFRFELEHLVERSRFSSYRIFGDYQGGALNRDSKEFIVVCQK